jgi:hypothetical protein
LTFDARILDGGSLTLQKGSQDRTLSVSFSGEESGEILFDVAAHDAQGCQIASGTVTEVIRRGGTVQKTVPMKLVMICNPDGGSPDGSDGGGSFPGCDPVKPAGGGAPGTIACSSDQTCQVNCTSQRNECVLGGSAPPGSTCLSNLDCQPGSQCFDYSSTGCGVKVCLRFCSSKADCSQSLGGGGGPGSFCEGRVSCDGVTDTAYHTCTFNCDPTESAAANHGGCPGALTCVMPASMDQVDCACPVGRTQTEGQTCTATNCAPGLICNQMGGTSRCRSICRCDKNAAGTCTATNTCGTGKTCTAVTNNTIYGICL